MLCFLTSRELVDRSHRLGQRHVGPSGEYKPRPIIVKFRSTKRDVWCSPPNAGLPVCSDLNYEPFKYIENNNYFMCDGIDPDSNIHNKISVDSLYYTESEFKEHFEFKQKGSSNFSLVHFNCRSMARNFDKLKDSVKGLDFPFDVGLIAVSETWFKDNDTSSSYSIEGYSSFQCSILNKTGGGVALYINETLQPNYLPNKSKCKLC